MIHWLARNEQKIRLAAAPSLPARLAQAVALVASLWCSSAGPLSHSAAHGGELTKTSHTTDEPARVELDQVPAWLNSLPEAAQRGYRHLTESVYLPADFDEEVFTRVMENGARQSPAFALGHVPSGMNVQRATTFQRYGLTERPGDGSGKPLQYVIDHGSGGAARWVMNCFACHGGSVYGTTFPGAPNTLYDLQSLTEDVRSAKLQLSKPLTHMDIGSLAMPLGTTVGTTNAVMFGVALMNYRDAELNVHEMRPPPRMAHHDMDAPAWWLFHRKRRLYADGFAEKGARGLMQFMLVRENGPEQFQQWESEFEDVYAFLESLRPPKYPGVIDQSLADRGRAAFNAHCARCHGTYASADQPDAGFYPEKLVAIDEIDTDRARLDALSSKHRSQYGKSWFAYFGQQETWLDPGGYMAPPLNGIWASAPYFHNGSVPTLWHVLHPDERPIVWQRTNIAMDQRRIGLSVAEYDTVPEPTTTRSRRSYFDTRTHGKSRQGHEFPNELSEAERAAVLEYLKTL